MMTGHRVLAILEAKPAAASECSPSPARIDNAWDGRMLQNAEGVSASPLLDDLGEVERGLLGWSSRKPRQVVARATVPRRPVGQSKAVTYTPRVPPPSAMR